MEKYTGLHIEEFTEHPEVKACLELLKRKFTDDNPLVVSDVLDEEGHQYVNLVQKGGGMLGVAHAGYTYILEEMGIRYMKVAGTSAGAINTALLTVIGEKQDAKSDRIIDSLFSLNFFNIIDAAPAIRLFLRYYMSIDNFFGLVKTIFKWILVVVALLIATDLFIISARNILPGLSTLGLVLFIITGTILFYISLFLFLAANAARQLSTFNYGINPGDFLYDWIKAQLLKNNVNTVSDLVKKAEAPIPGLRLRKENPHKLFGLKGSVTFITAELVTQNKIEFPAMCKLFREKENIDKLQPAGFIRASMSIPVFFDSFYITDIPTESPEVKQAWQDLLGVDNPPSSARFVDGGIISNFPINLFYDPKINVPRLPTFSIDLDDTIPEDPEKYIETLPIGGYLGRVFSTIRSYYDKEFLIRYKVYNRGIGKIPLAQFNWKNFFMPNEDKIRMLIIGAMAATKFLLDFNWENYKAERSRMHEDLSTQGINNIQS